MTHHQQLAERQSPRARPRREARIGKNASHPAPRVPERYEPEPEINRTDPARCARGDARSSHRGGSAGQGMPVQHWACANGAGKRCLPLRRDESRRERGGAVAVHASPRRPLLCGHHAHQARPPPRSALLELALRRQPLPCRAARRTNIPAPRTFAEGESLQNLGLFGIARARRRSIVALTFQANAAFDRGRLTLAPEARPDACCSTSVAMQAGVRPGHRAHAHRRRWCRAGTRRWKLSARARGTRPRRHLRCFSGSRCTA